MTVTRETLTAIRRPRLLIRAARFGVEDYERSRDLKRILRSDVVPAVGRAVSRLVEMEADQEEARQRGDASYSIATHLEILIALMAEARLLQSANDTEGETPAAASRRSQIVSLAAR
jgi:hypothetical protein